MKLSVNNYGSAYKNDKKALSQLGHSAEEVALRGNGVIRRLHTESFHVGYFTTLILIAHGKLFERNSCQFRNQKWKDMTTSIAGHAHLHSCQEMIAKDNVGITST